MQRLAAFLLTVSFLLPLAAFAAEINLVVTSGTSRIWEPVGAGVDFPPELAEEALSNKVRELAARPGSVVLDLGYFAGYERGTETAFDSKSSAFFSELGYSAANVTAKDYLLGASHRSGFKTRPADMDKFYVSSLDNTNTAYPPLPPATTVEKNGVSLRIASITSTDMISAVPGAVAECVAKYPEDVMREALAAGDGPLVVFSDLERVRNERIAAAYPAIALILETSDAADKDTVVGTTRIVPRAPANAIRTVSIEVADDDATAVKSVGSEEWTTAARYRSLFDPGLPTIGMSVPGRGRVAEIMAIDDQNVLVDVHRDRKFDDLTPRTNIYAYNLVIDGSRYRAYRLHHVVGSFRIPQDTFVILGEDRTIRRIETNLSAWPLRGYNTRLGEAFQTIINAKPDTWVLPAETTRGIEDEAQRLLENFVLTVELDKRLYPEAGTEE